PSNAFGPHAIDTLRFADGTTLTYSQLIDRGFDLRGTADGDTLVGTNAVDRIMGLEGNDVIASGAGDDVLDGGTGADQMSGGAGHDVYVVDQSGDTVQEESDEGTDTVRSRVTYALNANVENLTLTGSDAINGAGNAQSNVLTGNLAANVLDGGTGADRLIGGMGDDTYVIDNASDTVFEAAQEGTDTVQSAVSFTLGANVENLALTGSAAISGAGNERDNVLIGNSAANVLDGKEGADTLDGGAGADLLIGGAGDDWFQLSADATWGAGFVVKNVGSPDQPGNNQKISLSGKVRSFDRFQGDSGIDTLLGTADDDVIALDDSLSPSSGSLGPRLSGIDRIQTGDGHDIVDLTSTQYAYGDVTIDGENGNDVLWASGGNDRLLGGAGNDNLFGGAGADTLMGGDGADTLDGAAGEDTLMGGAGNDTYLVDDVEDTVIEQANEGTDTVKSAVSYVLGANVENLILTGTGAINATGNAQNNVLTGNSAANVLAGGKGNDTLKGDGGNDTYLFNRGDGQDKISENDRTPGNTDTVLFGADLSPLDLIVSRNVNDLRIAIYGSSDRLTISNWYGGAANQTEVIQAGNGQQLVNTQVEQLIQAMASFSADSGLTWEQALAQRPQDVQMVLAASWQ
ncbi:MAG TPA: calcium-binding protein, partial [Nitrospiraceae bacterium]|nr:calcium-binding protein [Nitrospiraceae bacterium]